MKKMLISMACGAVLLMGLAAIFAPAEARRGGGGGFHGGGHAGGHMHGGRAMHANVNRSRHVNRDVNVNRNINRNVAVNRNINRNVNRNVAVNRDRKYVYRNGRWGYWRNGAWVVAPLVAGATYAASCSYEYNRWQSTGSSYWRDRYYNCAN
jgi:hypothetical protein